MSGLGLFFVPSKLHFCVQSDAEAPRVTLQNAEWLPRTMALMQRWVAGVQPRAHFVGAIPGLQPADGPAAAALPLSRSRASALE